MCGFGEMLQMFATSRKVFWSKTSNNEKSAILAGTLLCFTEAYQELERWVWEKWMSGK